MQSHEKDKRIVNLLIGIDIVDIARLKNVLTRTPRFLERVFTQQEIEYCYRKADPYPSLAARFAAREAVRKLDAIFITGVRFHDAEVVVDAEGKPQLVLHEPLLQKARESKIYDLALSLSHSKEQAIAVVIASKG
jgi:holo-[acyl-carrier protein] synthase